MDIIQDIKISFVMSVYNTKLDWLDRSFGSIMKQTDHRWELILVDDGSDDVVAKRCDTLGRMDRRIHVYHQKNQGLSVARNYGMDNAKGEYVAFVDSDDWIEETYVERILEAERDQYFDLLAFGHEDIWADRNVIQLWGDKRIHSFDLSEKRGMQLICLSWYGHGYDYPMFFGAQWKIVYRREFLDRFHIRNTPGINKAQDSVFNLYALEHAQKIGYLNEVLYHYFINAYSVTGGYCKNIDRYQKLLLGYHKFIYESDKDEEFYEAYQNCMMVQFDGVLRSHFFHSKNDDPWKKKTADMKKYLNEDPYLSFLETRSSIHINVYKNIMFFAMKHKSLWLIRLVFMIKKVYRKSKKSVNT